MNRDLKAGDIRIADRDQTKMPGRPVCREALLRWAWRGEARSQKTILHQIVF
ncbi:hypothetical protein SBA6_1090015 [Candidatus Sulfopaludibacter sp. SbA6]|nr:hypothetical protein SBA6_1090015 [Candidatus Sulfopaludibacter sp. SbA6]